jgi:arylsulfatase A-like enzyme
VISRPYGRPARDDGHLVRSARLWLVAGALATALWSCDTDSVRPNVVILLMDTLRADRLGCYGYARDTSPNIDGLATTGVLFRRCYATADYTSASTASLLTGRYPLAHGYVNASHVLGDSNLTLAEILRGQGYRTGGFTANGLAGEKYGMDQGFDSFFEQNRASAQTMVQQISTFVRAADDRPYFVYAHFMDVHDPYRIPRPQWHRFTNADRFAFDMTDSLLYDRFIMDAWWSTVQAWQSPTSSPTDIERYFSDYAELYDAAVAYWDDTLGDLLALLSAEGGRPTIIIITSDHGEQLLEHGYFGHANSGYDVGLHIPLLIHDPELGPGPRTVEQSISIADLLPTLLTRLNIEIPGAVQGTQRWSLVPPPRETQGQDGTERDGIFTSGTFMSNRPFDTLIQTYREGDWKLILDRFRDRKELYNLAEDPGEQHDRFALQPGIVARLADGLRRHHGRDQELYAQQVRLALQQPSEKLRELRALGYLGQVRGLDTAPAQFQPMQPVSLTPFGPFGDEPDLAAFGDHLDFTTGRVIWGQVVRGFSDVVGRTHDSGSWFDRRATFLMHNAEQRSRVIFEVTILPDADGRWPTEVAVEFNDAVEQTWSITAAGAQRFEALVPERLAGDRMFHCGLRANHRFVWREGASPRLHLYRALKIRRVYMKH